MRTPHRASVGLRAGRALAGAALVLLCGCQGQPQGKAAAAREPAVIRSLRQFINSQSQAAQIAGAQARADQKLEDAQRAAAAISAANRDAINQEIGRRTAAEQTAAAAAAAKPREPEPGAPPPPITGDLSQYTFPTSPKGP
jgi:hypothetical protein